MFGSYRRKATRLLHTVPYLQKLGVTCDGLPPLLCKTFAQALVDQLLACGARAPASSLANASLSLSMGPADQLPCTSKTKLVFQMPPSQPFGSTGSGACLGVPAGMSACIDRLCEHSSVSVARERTAELRKWMLRKKDLDESFDGPAHCKQILAGKPMKLFGEMVEAAGHADVNLVRDIHNGFDLLGEIPSSSVLPKKTTVASLSIEDACRDPEITSEVYRLTLEERDKGWLTGPFTLADVPETAIVTRRFGVRQAVTTTATGVAAKICPIDDFTESLANLSCTCAETIDPHSVNIIVAGILKRCRSLRKSGRDARLLLRTIDLRKAYKQLPLSERLPFGAKPSVQGFCRASGAIWAVGQALLHIHWSVFFDDYVVVASPEEKGHLDLVLRSYFALIGWETSDEKDAGFKSVAKALGVEFSLDEIHLGLLRVQNTEARKRELVSTIESIVQQGGAHAKELECLRGRLQFAESQVFGRGPAFLEAVFGFQAREPLVYRLSGTWAASLVMAEKRTFDAAFEGHLAHVVHQNSTSNSKQPWERSIVNVPSVLPKAFLGRGRLGNVLTHTAAAPVKAPSGPSAINLTATGGKLPRKVGPSWIQRQSDNRHAAVMKWLRIAKEGGDFFGVCARVAEDAEAGLPASLQESLGDVFSLKASSTLHSRAGPVLRYMAFCWRIREQPFPLSEQKMYRFVKEYCSGAAPTFASSFMSSIGFMQYVLEAKVPADCVSSRLAGAVSKLYLEKRKLQQKPPLTASQIRALERIVLGLIPEVRADVDRYAAGCFLYCVFARARYSDMQCSGELAKDIVQGERGPRGYLEARVTRSKTSHNLERKTRYLAMVSPIWGLEQDSWALAWMEVAGRAGPAWGPDMPLLPSPTDGGQWQKAPMSAQAGARWLRHLLYRAGEDVASVKAVGTHSCKATLLSWMSKWGASKEIRSILGYHSSANAGTDVIYARDSVSPALRELEEMVSAVAYRRFFPDATRSGMFAESLAARGDAHDKAEVGSDSSSDRSDDEEEPDTLEEEKVVEDSVGDFEPSGCLRESLEGKAVFRHVTTRFIHLVASEEGTTFKCGRQITSSYLECSAIPRFLHPICRQCFPEAR
ncbi:unnamed protein product [Symbiodinium sp. CCMP2592]|nr:unnamed protein product [Symbiodinium sp. CCMP2592]